MEPERDYAIFSPTRKRYQLLFQEEVPTTFSFPKKLKRCQPLSLEKVPTTSLGPRSTRASITRCRHSEGSSAGRWPGFGHSGPSPQTTCRARTEPPMCLPPPHGNPVRGVGEVGTSTWMWRMQKRRSGQTALRSSGLASANAERFVDYRGKTITRTAPAAQSLRDEYRGGGRGESVDGLPCWGARQGVKACWRASSSPVSCYLLARYESR
jgi:hypothetical protein